MYIKRNSFNNKLKSFTLRISKTKHDYWFNSLTNTQKRTIFLTYIKKKKSLEENNKSFSFNKFIFSIKPKFKVNTLLLRENSINKLLQK